MKILKKIYRRLSHWTDVNNGSARAVYVSKLLQIGVNVAIPTRRLMLSVLNRIFVRNNFDFKPDILEREKLSKIKNSFKILFAGDLILLEDQVKRAWNDEKHEYVFDDMFEYTKKYIEAADLAIGVFEGSAAGAEAGYSTSNYGDGKRLALNFPDSFAQAIKRAGFDLVTTANNHLFDKGEKAISRTLDVLDLIGLDHTGSYRNIQEKDEKKIKIIERDGLKFAVLAYTYDCNGLPEDKLCNGEFAYATSLIVPPSSKNFKKVKDEIKKDFERAKALKPDFIIVLPHMGSQFLTAPDYYQKEWVKIFKDFGADIILADHTHSVQPAEIEFNHENNKKIFTLYSPGNYANVYREFNGDASILAEVYIDKDKKDIIGGGIIPMWTCSSLTGNYRPLPLNDIVCDKELSEKLTTYDFDRVIEVNNVISRTIFKREFKPDLIRERWYFDENGFKREHAEPLKCDFDISQNNFIKILNSEKVICFIGDSVTQGTKNGGFPYYEPLIDFIKSEVKNFSVGGGTVMTLIDNVDKITGSGAGLYITAIGTNDVRYCNSKICAMSPEEYISDIERLEFLIRQKQTDAKFIYIAPWHSIDGDPFCPLKFSEKLEKNKNYSLALKEHCKHNKFLFIDANDFIANKILLKPTCYYLLDHIHPNSKNGIDLYSMAVLINSEKFI